MARRTRSIVKQDISAPILVPEKIFTDLSWWTKLNDTEQVELKQESEQLAVALLNFGRSRLAIGEHLLKIRELLEPHGLFVKYLHNFHFTVKTAYRHMNGFKNAKGALPEAILAAAMARGYNMIGDSEEKPLGVYTAAVKHLPPPAEPNATQANAWLDSVEQVRKKVKTTSSPAIQTNGEPTNIITYDPEVLLKECFRFVENRFKKLRGTSKSKGQWMKKLIGLELAILGVSGSHAFAPESIPEDFRAIAGRPRLVAKEAKEAKVTAA